MRVSDTRSLPITTVASASLIALTIPFLALSQNEQTNTSEEKAVMQVERDMANAHVRGDVKTFERILADELTDTSYDGRVATKQDDLKQVQGSKGGFTIDFSTMNAHVYGDTAIVTGVAVIKAQNGGKELVLNLRFTDTFLKRQNQWQLIAAQQARIPVWRTHEMKDSELKPVTAQACTLEPSLKSINSDVATFLRFTNRTSHPVVIYWLNYEGKRDPSEEQKIMLKPGQSGFRQTYLTHPFVAADGTGKCLGIYEPRPDPSLAVIQEK